MPSRVRWVQAAVVSVLVVLIVGRFVAVTTADGLWVDALGVADRHAAISRLRLLLLAAAFAAAVVWCIGNLYLVYRSIGSVRVPRRLGNIEILEALPRRYILIATILLGLLLALALSHGADEWWYARALAGHSEAIGVADPVLRRDAAYYLFDLPWERIVHSYVTILAGLVLGVAAVFYAAMGAIRWQDRQLHVTDMARRHLGGLLAAFALALLWGYRLEPAEYVAGIHNVPLDDVLVSVRLPAARLLGALALVTTGASALWMWVPRNALALVPWFMLGVVSFFAHYVVPTFSGSVRPAEQLAVPDVDAARPELLELAYDVRPVEASLSVSASPDPATLARHGDRLAAGPIWDAFATTLVLNRIAKRGPVRYATVHLATYPDSARRPVPVYLGVPQIDLEELRASGAELSWERVHGPPYSFARGATAVVANSVSRRGLPLFVGDPTRPDWTADELTNIRLERPEVLFGPAATDFAVLSRADPEVVGVRTGGMLRRLALAWALQSPRLLTSELVADSSLLLWHRAITERLGRFAPFAQFDDPYAVVVDGELYWLVSGYVSATAFAAVPRVRWQGRWVRYLRSSLLGVVSASSGETAVYLIGEPDPLTRAWAELAPEIVRPGRELPPAIAPHVRYPSTAFDVQLEMLHAYRFRDGSAANSAGGQVVPTPGVGERPDAYWWVGTTPVDSVMRLRLSAVFEGGDPPLLTALVDGALVDGHPVLTLVRLPPPFEIEGPSLLTRRVALLRPPGVDGVDGAVRTVAFRDGVVRLQPMYSGRNDELEAAPRLVEIGIGWGNGVGRGATLNEALASLVTMARRQDGTVPHWEEVRRWFRRLDSARQAGDWIAFGRAYGELKRLLGTGADSLP